MISFRTLDRGWRASAVLVVLAAALAAGCRAPEDASSKPREEHGHDREGDHAGKHGDETGEHHEDDKQIVRLTAEQMASAGVTVETAGPARIDLGVELPGVVRPNGDRLAHIVPRFPGIVRDVRKAVGDTVRTGDVLAVIESSESLASYELKTLIDGTVIGKHITRGEAVDRDKGTFTIADLTSVWVELSVYPKDMARVGIGSPVRITAGHAEPEADGVVSYVTPIVDEATRTAMARVVLANLGGAWRPGMFVTARVLDASEAPVALPTSAVQTLEQRTVVFVEVEGGFEPRPVTLGKRGETRVEVIAGLAPGERAATTNSFILKAELGKGSAEHEH